jgi:glucuronate isomerase
MPYLLRNPLYHWSHLELKRFFAVDELLSPSTADKIWTLSSHQLNDGLSARELMQQSNVRVVCTTDDPADSLEHHRAVAVDPTFKIQMLPTWRPDKAMDVNDSASYNAYLDRLTASADMEIATYSDLILALRKRHEHFHRLGCRLSDHGLDSCYALSVDQTQARTIFAKVREGATLSIDEIIRFKSAMMMEFGRMDAEKGWTQQLHIGALRNTNSKMMALLGPDTGFDCMGDENYARSLATYLDNLNSEGNLPKTIIYNLNPRDNEMIAALIGCFQDGSVPGKIQFGSGWWFLDQLNGMERQIETISQLGLLSRFVGMLTDSRSFLSYTRHEYFRRMLCNLLGNEMSHGLIPMDFKLVGALVEAISYKNAAKYFDFSLLDT